jgi:hypothetical protein
MRERSAISTIKGYFYQFDCSILQLLKLVGKEDSIVVEGIEDIDVNIGEEYESIQCKYYEETEYNHSVISKAIRYFISDFSNRKKQGEVLINYSLYGYYKRGQAKLPSKIDIQFIKDSFLTYKKDQVKHELHKELGLSDDDLLEFSTKLKIDNNASSYDNQLEEIFTQLMDVFSCNKYDAEYFYYNNSLKIIKDIAVCSNEEMRKISKQEFIEKIDTKKLIYNKWFYQFNTEKRIFSSIKKEYFTYKNIDPYARMFLIEIDSMRYKRQDIKDIIYLIMTKWGKVSRRAKPPFCPYIYLHDLPNNELIEIKKELAKENIGFIDGYSFYGADFNVSNMVQELPNNGSIRLKVINEINNLDEIIKSTAVRTEIYQFYITNSFYNAPDTVKDVKIQIREIMNIKEII